MLSDPLAARMRVVEIARSMIGQKWPGPDGCFLSALHGAERAPSWWAANPPHWCGIFALWCCREAGLTDYQWHLGNGISQALPRITIPMPGDVAYFIRGQHHAVYAGLLPSFSYETIDGNSGKWATRRTSSVQRVERESPPDAVYSVAPWLGAASRM